MGNKLKSKSNGGSLFNHQGRRSRRDMEVCGRECSNQRRQVGHPSKQQHGGGRHHLNLPHHQDQWGYLGVSGGTPALWSPDRGDSKSAGGARGRWRREGGGFGGFLLSFSLSRESESESESHFNFVIIAVFLEFVSVLEKGLRPLVLAINVSKFLPASIAVKDN